LQWTDKDQRAYTVEISVFYDKINVEAREDSGKRKLWSLKDYVGECNVDSSIELALPSFEVVDLFSSEDKVVLFAYTIGCIGGIDPVDVKYFAFYKGKKHSLRGRESFIGVEGVTDLAPPPVPDYNLRENKVILNYILKKWPSISARVFF